VTEDPVDALRISSTRADYPSMARLARALYATGLGPSEVLHQCYGVEFPAEFWLLVPERLAKPHLLATFTNQPWEMGVPPGQGGADLEPFEPTEDVEQELFARDPDLLPLMRLPTTRSTLANAVVCYRITELQAGSTAIFGTKMVIDWDPVMDPEPDPDPEITRYGESLLDVLHGHHAEELHSLEESLDAPENRRFGAVSEKVVNEVRSLVERIETMRREVADWQDTT
jgi:hypothetical protein